MRKIILALLLAFTATVGFCQGTETPGESAFVKQIQEFDRLVAAHKLLEASKLIEDFKARKTALEIVGIFESAIYMAERRWADAAKKLETARPLFDEHPETLAYIDRQLARCYGKLGMIIQQLEKYRAAIENTPEADILPVSTEYIIALNSADKTEELDVAISDLIEKIGAKAFMEIPQLRSIRIALEIQKTSNLPAHLQDWGKLKVVLDSSGIEKDSPEAVLLGARLLMKQGRHDDARHFLKQAIADNPDFPGFVSYLALMEADLKNFDEALRILDEQIAKDGPTPATLIVKTRILAKMPPEDATVLLRKMEEEVEGLSEQAKITLLKQIAPAWQAIRNDAEAKRVFETLAELEPDNAGTLIHLFDIARKAGDEPGMTERMEQVRELAGKDSPEEIYCRAAWEVHRFMTNNAAREELEDARKLLLKAKNRRPSWPNIPRALAEIALLQKNYAKAIEHLYEIDKLGALTTQQLELLIKLLYNEKRTEEIPALLEGKTLSPEMQRIQDALTGEAPSSPIRPQAISYEARLEQYRKAAEQEPENPHCWLAIMQTLKLLGRDNDELLAVKAEMEKAVPADKLPLPLAKVYEMLGDAPAAEKAFLEVVENAPENLHARYSISAFYLRTLSQELARLHLEKMQALIDASDADERIKAQQREWVEKSLAELEEKE